MSESKLKLKSSQRLGGIATAVLGLVIVFLIVLLVNFLFGKISMRADLTENNVYTLSKGTKNILQGLDTPVTIRYYVTDDRRVMGPGERAYALRVENKLDEFVRNAPTGEIEIANEKGEFEKKKVKMLTVQKLNPEPNTDAEDAAIADGLQAGISGETNNEVFFGIAIECIDKRETIPFLPARTETLLEYDLARAISNVHNSKDEKIVVMTSLPIGGGFSGNFQAPPQQPWMFFEQLEKDYEVEVIDPAATAIPDDTTTLVIMHPHDITPEAQFAVDQYLLQGGNVMAFVDPNFFYARALAQGQPQMPGMPPQGGPPPSSTLDKLFSAWGVTFDENRVLADLTFGSEIMRRGNFSPTFLTLDRNALGSDPDDPGLNDPMTNQLTHLNMLTPGGFEIDAPEGVTVEALVSSSPMNQLVSSFDADPTMEGGAERIRKDFEAHGESRTLVARLSGEFKTAFPEGNPAKAEGEENEDGSEAEADADSEEKPEDEAEEKEGEKKEAAAEDEKFLEKSSEPGRVLLVADMDFIYDDMFVQKTQIPGLNIVIPQLLNENLTLVQNAIEQLAGDPNLIAVRSRNSARRPFTKPNEWRRAAEDKYSAEVEQFQQQASDAQTRLNELLSATPDNLDEALLSAPVQEEIEKLREEESAFRKRVRDLQKEVTREYRQKLAFYKFSNTLAVPILLILFGIGLAIYRKAQTAAR